MNSPHQITSAELPEVPIEKWLSAEELGAQFLVSKHTVSNYRRQGIIEPVFVKKFPGRLFRFHPSVVPFLEKKFREAHFGSRALFSQPPGSAAAGPLQSVCND
jgi:hypothetical protein